MMTWRSSGYMIRLRRLFVPVWRCSGSCWMKAKLAIHWCAIAWHQTRGCRARPGSGGPGYYHSAYAVQGRGIRAQQGGGGRHTPFFPGYRPQFYFRTTDVTGDIQLEEGVEMIMPGDHTTMEVELITS